MAVIGVVGAGLVGTRVAASLASRGHRVHLATTRAIDGLVAQVSVAQKLPDEVDVAVLAQPSSAQPAVADRLIGRGIATVATADAPSDVAELLGLGPAAEAGGTTLIVGAAMSPGLTGLLATTLVATLDTVTEIETAMFGTGGPACARRHHRSMKEPGVEVVDGVPQRRRAGTGRRLVWFPDPIGGADCFIAGLSDPVLLRRSFPDTPVIRSRMAATRRDRLTARLPMLRPPHAEGLVGAVVVEVRGSSSSGVEHRLAAALAPQATATAAVAAMSAGRVSTGALDPGVVLVADLDDARGALRELASDIRFLDYDGLARGEAQTAQRRTARKPRKT